jgi:hypothetical protein
MATYFASLEQNAQKDRSKSILNRPSTRFNLDPPAIRNSEEQRRHFGNSSPVVSGIKTIFDLNEAPRHHLDVYCLQYFSPA